jgi:hypothetical protein
MAIILLTLKRRLPRREVYTEPVAVLLVLLGIMEN